MTTARTTKGSITARHSIEDCGIKIADSSASATLVYVGSLSNLKTTASTFIIGQSAPSNSIPTSLKITQILSAPFEVTSVELRGGPGGTGRLTIGLASPTYTTEGASPTTNNVDWQLEWTLVERALKLHPTFAPLFDPENNNYSFESIDKWECLPPEYATYKAQFKIPDRLDKPTTWTVLPALAKKYCEKLAKDMRAYTVQVPVVRKIEHKTSGPPSGSDSSSSCGQREAPERFATLRDAWLKTADSWSKTGLSRWEHRQEWSGFDSLDEDLYPTTTPTSTISS